MTAHHTGGRGGGYITGFEFGVRLSLEFNGSVAV